MSESKRLHPVAAVSSAIKLIKDALIPLVIFILFGGGGVSGRWAMFEFIAIPVFILLFVGYGILDWLRFTYRIEAGELRIESGVFIRKKRYIRFERIHSLDKTEGILQRLFGLVKLKVETAGSSGDQADATLTAISKNEAERINRIFHEVKSSGKIASAAETQEIQGVEKTEEIQSVFQQSFRELFIMAATSGGVGVVFSGALAFFGQFEEIIPYTRLFTGFEQFAKGSVAFIAIIVVFGLLFAYLIATAGIVLKYAFFTVKKNEDKIVISRGLLERRQLTIPLEKVQAIRITENLIRQPLGYASVYVEYAGGSILDKESSHIMLFPLIKKEKIQEMIRQFIPEYEIQVQVNPLPKRSFKRYQFRVWLIIIPAAAICSYLYQPWGYLSLLFMPLGASWAYLCYRGAGWNITGNQLQLRSRFFSKQTFIFQKKRIQAVYSEVSPFQKRANLASVSAVVKSGAGPRAGKVVDLEAEDSDRIKEWFFERKN
ncbi:hypothetical protein ELQ35_17730 [Peribacillus cavernae]|uniref:YdbS-like PH domain-containing protein n=1 Tax=Peribacillus cavernae TaxID=1674310 RepID=A0A3S0W3N7_9BACI|nr:PH domain-containing protein [Peribacillus cavernae]MDQ0221331.1 putative membrane protein [Peribacillus cavernae]RUQ26976.1 hypothetical protein ELQ35_17730 [Peribacillus cavernae]